MRLRLQAEPSEDEEDVSDDLDPQSEGGSDDGSGSGDEAEQQQQQPKRAGGKLAVALKKKQGPGVCHVCGEKGHVAGFQGAVYVDCINRPCFLCKTPGHTTATCPHRVEDGFDVAPERVTGSAPPTPALLVECETTGRRLSGRELPCSFPRHQVDAAILRLHKRRVTTLAFPPDSDRLVVSGDKKGGVAVWNFEEVHDRTLYTSIFEAGPLAAIRHLPWASSLGWAGAAADGTVRLFDIDTAAHQELLNLNPNGWQEGVRWEMLASLDCCGGARGGHDAQALLAGDSEGRLHVIDPRAGSTGRTGNAAAAGSSGGGSGGGGGGSGGNGAVVAVAQVHKTKTRVCSVAAHPLGAPRVLTGGNDHTMRVLDLRKLCSRFHTAYQPLPGERPDTATAAAAAAASDSAAAISSASVDAPARAIAAAPAGPQSASGARGRGRGRGRRGGGSAAAAGSGRGGRGSGRGGGAGAAAGHPCQVAVIPHGSVVNSAYWSPLTGRKILTTCQDNRLRVWDLFAAAEAGRAPDREIVHSHNFNRHLTAFRAEWDPKDPTERLVVCGRYISEVYSGLALHPIDVLDASTGRTLRALADENLTTISPVVAFHPRRDILISGSSGSLYAWHPVTGRGGDGWPGDGGDDGGGWGFDSDGDSSDSDGGGGGGGGDIADMVRRAGASSSYVFFDASVAAARNKAAAGGSGGGRGRGGERRGRGGGRGGGAAAGGKRKAPAGWDDAGSEEGAEEGSESE